MHFICFTGIATAYVNNMCIKSFLLFSYPIWYLDVKEKLQKYKNKSHEIHNCIREGRKKAVAEQFYPSRCLYWTSRYFSYIYFFVIVSKDCLQTQWDSFKSKVIQTQFILWEKRTFIFFICANIPNLTE